MTRKTQTIVRTILLALTAVNAAIQMVGVVDLGSDTANTVYRVISLIALIASTAWAWWKNNSITPEAQKADEYLDDLKKGGEDA